MFARCAFVIGIGVVCLSGRGAAGDWPQFRGPNGAGVSTESDLPADWSADRNVAWKERVYGYFGMVGLFCYDLTGKLLWSKDLGAYRMQGNWGTSGSPALDGDRLFIQCDNQDRSFLVALDRKTGKELWRVTRPERTTW